MSSSTRCAACRYLRRKCPQDCILAPYFPSSDLERFACVHKIFGASNVTKTLQQLPEHLRGKSVESMVYEANERIRDPVYGCAGLITQLQQQIVQLQSEIIRTESEIARSVASTRHQPPQTHGDGLQDQSLFLLNLGQNEDDLMNDQHTPCSSF